MRLILFICLLTGFSVTAWASGQIDVERLANAIGRAENSVKYPYGVRSINTYGDKVKARRICINSIKSAEKRCKGRDLIVCMGEKYSPPSINPNWVRLVKYFYERGLK